MKNSPTCAVIVSYYPTEQLLGNVQLLFDQLEHVIIVDNSAEGHESGALRNLEADSKCTMIRNGKNLGVAAALNIGIRYAIAHGFPWVITLDQDSQISDDYVEKMLCAYEEASKHSRVGIVFPAYRDARLGHAIPPLRSVNGDVLVCMTSGALIHENVFTSVGLMESQLVIDSVDHEYCLRMRRLGLKLVECPSAVLLHSLGHITFHSLRGRRLSTSNHSAKRRYYITRNRLILMKRYFFIDPEWVKIELNRMVMETLALFLFERNRTLKAIYMGRAVFDATFGRLGQRVALGSFPVVPSRGDSRSEP